MLHIEIAILEIDDVKHAAVYVTAFNHTSTFELETY